MQIAHAVKTLKPSYIRDILAAASAEGVISLAGGLPASQLFPHQLLAEAAASLEHTPQVYQYGDSRGYAPLLNHLHQLYQLPGDHSAIVCNGSQQGIDLIARTYLNSGDSVVMESPSYLGAIQVFDLAGVQIETIKQHEDGPDLQALEELFTRGRIKLFYAVPDFHNPTGICWSLPVRQHVARLCQHYNVLLIEDVPYRELRFNGEAQPLVSSFCPSHALVLRSFSKIAAPGLRIGVLSGPKQHLNYILNVKQACDLHTGFPMQAVALQLIKHPAFRDHINNVRACYFERYQALAAALNEHLDCEHSSQAVDGGMFLWLQLPGVEPIEIARCALEQGVAVVPGDVFFTEHSLMKPALRLNFSCESPDKLDEAIKRLRSAIRRTGH